MIDLDRFKNVNDSLGQAAGDALLRQVAVRLKLALREDDVLARLGGDEFAIIQAECEDQKSGSIDLATRISKLIAEPFLLPGHQVEIGTSIGIAMAPEHGSDRELLHPVRRGDVGGTGSPQHAGKRLARRHRPLRVRGALSTVLRRPDQPAAGTGSAGALASPGARADPPGP